MIKAFAATEPGGELKPFEYDAGELLPGEVEIAVMSCGICHSDLSMLDNDWGQSQYPLVPGHEIVGKVAALGEEVPGNLQVGDLVGLGWYSQSCLHCQSCLEGDHNLCLNNPGQTIVGRHGGFADKVRCHWEWAIPLPKGLDVGKTGPLFCGGITVFNPIVQLGITPTDRVGVIGIGGLGHMALMFLRAWGCEVVAFSSSDAKTEEAKKMGAHTVVNSRDKQAIQNIAGSLDCIISTVNVPLDWEGYLSALAPKGKLHLVGAVLEPIPVGAFSLIGKQKSVSGSPLGSPATTRKMLEFCARHELSPVTEHFPMSKVNDALQHLRDGKARYRIVLDSD